MADKTKWKVRRCWGGEWFAGYDEGCTIWTKHEADAKIMDHSKATDVAADLGRQIKHGDRIYMIGPLAAPSPIKTETGDG